MYTFEKKVIGFFIIVGCLLLGITYFSDIPVKDSSTLKIFLGIGFIFVSYALLCLESLMDKIKYERRQAEWLNLP